MTTTNTITKLTIALLALLAVSGCVNPQIAGQANPSFPAAHLGVGGEITSPDIDL